MAWKRPGIDAPRVIRSALVGWMLASAVEYLLCPVDLSGVAGLEQMSLPRLLALTALGFLLALLLPGQRWQRWMLVASFCVLAVAGLWVSFSVSLLVGCLALLAVLVVYALRGWDGSRPMAPAAEKASPRCRRVVLALAALFFLFVSAWTVCRYWSFRTPTYDFGIFSQMFASMKATGQPVTTLERDGTLSHFAVHMSPIYYLMLPFYALVPSPATLQVLQAAVMTLAVVPLWMLGRCHGLPAWQRGMLCALLLLYPAFSGGVAYDLHENCFLTVLLLCLFYGLDSGNWAVTAVSALLTLLVKEDAAVYVAVAGLYALVSGALDGRGKRSLSGGLLMVAAVAWFLAATSYLASSGDGVMTDRYDNFIYDGSGSLLTVVKTVVLCPMKVVQEATEPEKLSYLLIMLSPLLGMPLITRRYQRYLLLIPMVLVNLMSDYAYQHSIFFQYNFGTIAFLFYLTVVNLADVRIAPRRLAALALSLSVSVGCFAATVVPKAVKYPMLCVQNGASYRQLRQLLAQVPEDASVTACCFYTSFLSDRETLYDVRHTSREHLLSSDYVVLDLNDSDSFEGYGGLDELTELLEQQGYTLLDSIAGQTAIYKKDPA